MLPLALTCGDPGGIGLECAVLAWAKRDREHIPPFFLLADPVAVERRAHAIGKPVKISVVEPERAFAEFGHTLPVVALQNRLSGDAGKSEPSNAPGIIESIDRAVAYAFEGLSSGLVTLPIAKKPLHDAGFTFPGHTEYLAHLANEKLGVAMHPVMMLAGPDLRTVPVTVHVALARVPELLTRVLIEETCRITARDLRDRFGIAAPRLAVTGLNPHAGEDGAFGNEEKRIILPAIVKLRSEGIAIEGPLPADTLFHANARKRFDVAICMYHDQALIPVKALDFAHTVNVTLGLPFVRTSPDHGTAFDLAGSGRADPSSLVEALRLASRLAAKKSVKST